jgi:hypothetical protein
MSPILRSALASALTLVAAACSSGSSDSAQGTVVRGTTCNVEGAKATAVDGCNLCQCDSGTWACSSLQCSSACEDGAQRSDGCNTCTCDAGSWQCTMMECSSSCHGRAAPPEDGCNTCVCTEDGTWACTDAYCPEPECVEGESRTVSRYEVCTCSGRPWMCQGTPCHQPMCPEPQALDGEQGCAAVVVYARDPETGTCCEYGDPCSAPGSWEHFYSQAECEGGGACSPGDTRRADDGCNTCSCDDEGEWACTEMACEGPVSCGGWSGPTCTDDEYCAYTAGLYCGAADASAFCETRPLSCESADDPVCGCDGNDYASLCLAAMAGTGVLDEGPCTAVNF